MPLTHLSLSKKLILLVLLPALVQLGIILGLGVLQYQAGIAAAEAEHARQVYNACDLLMRHMLRMMSVSDPRAFLGRTPDAQALNQQQTSIYKQFSLLKELIKDNAKELQVVNDSERLCLQAMAIVQQLKEMHEHGDIQDRPERKPLTAQLRRLVQQMVSPELVDLADHQSQIADRGPVIQRSLRDQGLWLIVILGLVNAALTGLLAVFLVRRIAQPLERLQDNGYFMAEGTALHGEAEVSAYPDEIVTLDHSFHQMARSINQLTARQDALVDNAGDMVCTMDEEGKITSANSAAGKLFACHPAELIDKNYRDLVHPQDVSELSSYLQRILASGPDTGVHLRLLGKGQRTLHVLWSAQWTTSENQFFSVVHDLTQLQEAQSMKQEVVAIVTQDLQTPLACLQGLLDSLEETAAAGAELQHHIDLVRSKANHMSMLISDLVDLEQAKNGLLALSAGPLNLDKLIDQVQVVVGPAAEAQDVVLDCRRGGLTISGEEDKLIRVLTNLLGNAVQYAPRETSILVVSKGEDGFAHVSISDKGAAVVAQNIGTIFDAFSPRAANENTALPEDAADRQAIGSGLGLALSKAFVELHGGKVAAASKEGEGTTISFTLPLGAGKS